MHNQTANNLNEDRAANDVDAYDSRLEETQKLHALSFSNYMKERGYIYLNRPQGPELHSIWTGKTYPYHAEYNLFLQWCKKQPEVDAKPNLTIVHDALVQGLKFVSGKTFAPGSAVPLIYETDGVPVLNTWQPYEPKTEDTSDVDLSLWLEYLERLFPVAEERHTVCQWLAHMFQRPEEKPSWHLMLTSDTGTGKGFLFHNILYLLLNRQATLLNSYDKLTGKFSTVLSSSVLVFLDDCQSMSKTLQTQLKSLLTERRQQVEEKYVQAQMIDTCTRFILASNEKRPLKLDANERRWYAITYMEHRQDRRDTERFIDRLETWLQQEGSLDALYFWFQQYDLAGFNPNRCEQTTTLTDMIEQSRSMLDIGLADWLESNRVFKMDTLKLVFNEHPDKVKRKLEELGYRQARINSNGQGVDRSRYWFPLDWKPKQAAQWLEERRFDHDDTSTPF